jgi:hypothetical protein
MPYKATFTIKGLGWGNQKHALLKQQLINLDIGQFDTNKNKCTHRMEDYVSHEETNKTDSN